jgi:hypothetical protein
LQDRDANELHRFKIDRIDTSTTVLQYAVTGGEPMLAQLAADVQWTLNWANRQSHVFYVEDVQAGAPLRWKDGLMRRSGAQSSTVDADKDVVSIETTWAEGLSARTTRVAVKPRDSFEGHAVDGDVLVTEIRREGSVIGTANYFTRQRIYAWKIASVPDGWIAEEHLKPRFGGWTFTPDMIWMNLQSIALYYWKSTIDQKGFVARNRPEAAEAAPSALQRVANVLAPTIYANEPGCDYPLHWLDGTFFRYCCDIHDLCYEKYGCTSSTWWRWFTSWRCDYCNMWTVWCFADGGGGSHILYPYP